MKILILGGTGAIGEELVPLLAESADTELVITTRRKIDSFQNIKYVQGNAMDLKFVKRLIEHGKFDVIVDFMLYSTEEFKERYTFLLVSCGQYIFFSSSRVYAASDTPITEDSERLLDVSTDYNYLERGEYSLTKAQEENILRNSNYKNWVIVRPYKTYSKSRLQLGVLEKEEWIYRAITGKTIVILGDVQNLHTSLTSSKDTALILQRIIGNSQLNTQTIQIANPDRITWGDVIQLYLDCIEKQYGRRPKVYYLKDTSGIELLFRNTYRIKYDGLIDRVFDDIKVRTLMGDAFQWSPINVGLIQCVNAYIDKTQEKKPIPNYSVEGIFDRLTGDNEPFVSITGIKNKIKYLLYRRFSIKTIYRMKKMICGE